MAVSALAGGLIGSGVINGASTIGNGIYGWINDKYNKEQNEWNKQFAREQFEHQKDIFNYQKDLNKQVMEREDNAVQRRAKDLEAAGISKNLAAGSSASAQVMSSAGSSGIPSAAQQRQISKLDKKIIDDELLTKEIERQGMESQKDKNRSEANLNDAKKDTEGAIKDMYESEAKYYDSMTNSNKHNLEYAEFFHMPTGLSARASNKYELLSSLGQYFLQTAFKGGSAESYQSAYDGYKEALDKIEDLSNEDKDKLLKQFIKDRSALGEVKEGHLYP